MFKFLPTHTHTHTHNQTISTIVILQSPSTLSAAMFKFQLRLFLFLYLLSIKIHPISDLEATRGRHTHRRNSSFVVCQSVKRASVCHGASGCRAETTMIARIWNLKGCKTSFIEKCYHVKDLIKFASVNTQNDPTSTTYRNDFCTVSLTASIST